MVEQRKKSCTWSIKICLLLISTTSVIPANHSGISLNQYPYKYQQQKSHTKYSLGDTSLTSTSASESRPQLEISRTTLVWTVMVPIASLVLINIILGYLWDQPTNKQCLINLLYRDVLGANISHIFLWSFTIIYCEFNRQMPFSKPQAEFIAYTNQILTLLILGYLNTIGIIRLCTVKHKQLDLLIPFLGESDEIALRNIRSGIYLIMGAIFGAEFFLSAIPPVYYPLSQGIKIHINDLSYGSIAVIAFQLFLLSAGAILHICAKIFINKENAKMRPVILKHGKTSQINDMGLQDKHETVLTHFSRKYGFIAPVLPNVAMMVGLIIVIGIQLLLPPKQKDGENNTTFWPLVSVTIGFEGVFFPSWLIFRNKSLRSYAKKRAAKIIGKLITIYRKFSNPLLQVRRNNSITPR